MVDAYADREYLKKQMSREYKTRDRKQKLYDLNLQQKQLEYAMIKRLVLEKGRIDVLFTQVLDYKLYGFHAKAMRFQYNNKNRSLVLAPRDAGKSTVLTYTKIIYEILRNPNVRIALVSNTGYQAEGFLKEVKNHLEGNQKLIEIFGKQIGTKWDTKEIVVKDKTSRNKESTVTCLGVGTALVGKHFDIIIGDDLVDEESSRTELQRERQRTWFYQTLYPTLSSKADCENGDQIHLVGTRYHYLDLWGHLMGTTDHDGGGEFKNCFLRVKAINVDKKTGKEYSFLPERVSLEKLKAKRKNMGTIIFNAQMQNDTEAMKGKMFKEPWFRYYEVLPKNIRRYTGVDLAISTKDSADSFAHATVGIDGEGRIYIVSFYERKALPPKKQTKYICDQAKIEEPLFVGIESNAYQAAKADDVLEIDPTINVKKIFTSKDKITKGWKLSAVFEAGKVYIGPNMHKLKEHLLLFTGERGGDDDLFDAIYNAISLGLWSKSKRTREKEPGIL